MTVKINVNRKRIHKEIPSWRKEYKYYTTCLQVSDYFCYLKCLSMIVLKIILYRQKRKKMIKIVIKEQ